tara:strand:+ start:180 stop:380 length:201 start_codon:yes stop_codon:yes gene_type:complete
MDIPSKLAAIEQKLDSMHEDLVENKKDIEELKKRMNMGAGGIKAVAIFGGLIVAITIFFTDLLGLK